MSIQKLSLYNFRNFKKKNFLFSSSLNLCVGANATGKTAILESIFFLSRGQSFRAARLSQLIHWSAQEAYVLALLKTKSLEIKIHTLPPLSVGTTARVEKKYLLNGAPRPRKDFLPHLFTVIFRPEDLNLVTRSPSGRRDFLNQLLSHALPLYHRALLSYNHSLFQRNRLLLQIQKKQASPKELFFWDQSLLKNGQIIQKARQDFFEFANQHLHTSKHSLIRPYSFSFTPSLISQEIIGKNRSLDIQRSSTKSGPHRDDFLFLQEKLPPKRQNLAWWGSRGQQRLAVIALKIAETAYIQAKQKQTPIFLLDDVFSELDQKHSSLLFSTLSRLQTFISSNKIPLVKDLTSKAQITNLDV